MVRYTTIAVDPNTHAMLKKRAGGWGIATYLRNLMRKIDLLEAMDDEKVLDLIQRMQQIERILGVNIPDEHNKNSV